MDPLACPDDDATLLLVEKQATWGGVLLCCPDCGEFWTHTEAGVVAPPDGEF